MSTAKYTISHFMPTLFVDDIDAAIDFWEKMGWTESFRYPEGDAPTSHAGVKSAECSLMFALFEGQGGLDSIPPQIVYTFVGNVDAYHAHRVAAFEEHGDVLRALGAGRAKLGQIDDYDYGMRDFDLTDPWDHRLNCGEGLDRIRDRQKSSS